MLFHHPALVTLACLKIAVEEANEAQEKSGGAKLELPADWLEVWLVCIDWLDKLVMCRLTIGVSTGWICEWCADWLEV